MCSASTRCRASSWWHLTPAQRRAYMLADNKLALNAGWDLEMLSLEIGELGEAGFDLSLTGFDEFELGELFAERTQGRTDPDDAPEPPRTRAPSPAAYGCSAALQCSAATARWRPTWSACSVASPRTLWSPTRPTALITTRLGATRPADQLMGRPGGLRPASRSGRGRSAKSSMTTGLTGARPGRCSP